MSVTAWKNCGTVANFDAGGTTWDNDDGTAISATRVQSNDNLFAAQLDSSIMGMGQSQWLHCTNFGFSSADIPNGSLISGFEVEVRQYRTVSAEPIATTSLKFIKANTLVGSDIGTSSDWATTEAAVVYGGSSELGGGIWLQGDVTSSQFGVGVKIVGQNTLLLVGDIYSFFIDQVRIRAYYSFATSQMAGILSVQGVSSVTF